MLGVLLPVVEYRWPRTGRYLPSATGLGMGWVVPFSVTLSIALGAVLAAVWRRAGAAAEEQFRVPVASGLIAGDSLVHAGLAMLATALGLFSAAGR